MSCSNATLSGRRKDTAAYASLSFFTCQRAVSPQPETRREPRTTPSTLARRDPEASIRPASQWPPSMKSYLVDPDFQVNTHSEEFLNFFECLSASQTTGKANPFSEDGFLLSYTYREGDCLSMNIRILRQRSLQMLRMASRSRARVNCQR